MLHDFPFLIALAMNAISSVYFSICSPSSCQFSCVTPLLFIMSDDSCCLFLGFFVGGVITGLLAKLCCSYSHLFNVQS